MQNKRVNQKEELKLKEVQRKGLSESYGRVKEGLNSYLPRYDDPTEILFNPVGYFQKVLEK